MPKPVVPFSKETTSRRNSVQQAPEDVVQRRRWIILAIVVTGTFMAILDIFIVNVAIPSIRSGLKANFSDVEFVVAGYTLAYAVLVITGGRLGDIYGRKSIFMLGMGCFTLASAFCGLAPSIGILIASRVLQGVGAALMYPQVLSIIQVTFDNQERKTALGVFGAAVGLAAIVGQLLGGILIQVNIVGLTWRPIFLLNIPVGIIALLAAAIFLTNQQRSSDIRLDIPGVAIVTVALLLLTIPLVNGREAGWPWWMILSLLASFPVFVFFGWFEQRLALHGGFPLVNLALFKQRAFTVGVIIAITFFASNAGALFVLTLFLQIGLGFSALHSGLTFAFYALAFFVASLLAPRLISRLGRNLLSLAYFIVVIGALAILVTLLAAGTAISSWLLAPAFIIHGFGQGLGMSQLVGIIVSRIQSKDAGAASGVITTAFQIGNALGIAVISLIFFIALGMQSRVSHAQQYENALIWALPFVAILALVACVLVFFLPRTEAQKQTN